VELIVNGTVAEQIPISVDLNPEETYTGSFDTITLTGPWDAISVCADANEEVDELNEDNNCVDFNWPPILKGDVNGDRSVDLADAILAIQVLTGVNPAGILLEADVNGDGKIGLEEAIYILQIVGQVR